MDKKKSVIVSINGKQSHLQESSRVNRSHNKQSVGKYEQTPNEVQPYEKDYSFTSKQKDSIKQRPSLHHMKPLLIAIFSALTIGALLGFIMLVMFKGVGDQPPSQSAVTNNSEENENNNDDQNEEMEQGGDDLVNVQDVQAYVLQSGVFSEMENAKEWKKPYQDAGQPTVIWERDGEYYLFAGISATRQQGKDDAEELSKSDLDIFVKEWNIKASKVNVTEDESDWIHSFQTLWEETLQSVSEDNGMLVDQWKQFIDQESSQSENILSFQSELKQLLPEENLQEDRFQQQQFLLKIWYEFEQLLNEI